jgi:hypothetical protein
VKLGSSVAMVTRSAGTCVANRIRSELKKVDHANVVLNDHILIKWPDKKVNESQPKRNLPINGIVGPINLFPFRGESTECSSEDVSGA